MSHRNLFFESLFYGLACFLRFMRIEAIWTNIESPERSAKPTLWIANHMSFWDGFVLKWLIQDFDSSRDLCFVVSAKEWNRNLWFRKINTLPIDPRSPRSVRNIFSFIARFDGDTVFFPQGKIWPSTRRPLGFKRGIEVLLRHLPKDEGIRLIPVGLHLEPMNRSRSQIFARVGTPIQINKQEFYNVSKIEMEVESLVNQILNDLHGFGETIGPNWKKLK